MLWEDCIHSSFPTLDWPIFEIAATSREVLHLLICEPIYRIFSLPAAAASSVLEVEGGRDDNGDAEGDGEDQGGDAEDHQVGTV